MGGSLLLLLKLLLFHSAALPHGGYCLQDGYIELPVQGYDVKEPVARG